MSTTVRVSQETHERLVALASTTGLQIQTIVSEAVSAYEADMFWDAFDTACTRLTNDPYMLAELEAERTGEAPALADGIDRD